MPNWNELLDKLKADGSNTDILRRRCLKNLHNYTKRNTILYYSGWMQATMKKNPGPPETYSISDTDKNAFMSVIHKLDKEKGLDLILHTPGGELGSVESIIIYLRSIFGEDIRAVVPQSAMSAGTILACACKTIIMGRQSNLGPFDPQVAGVPARALLEEFDEAVRQMNEPNNVGATRAWQTIFQRIHPSLITQCKHISDNTDKIVQDFLISGMFNGMRDAKKKAKRITNYLGNIKETRFHGRHIHKDKAKEIGLVIEDLENDDKLQDLVLTLHHSCMLSFEMSPCVKIVENQRETSVILASAN